MEKVKADLQKITGKKPPKVEQKVTQVDLSVD
jgi:hypothetical protein